MHNKIQVGIIGYKDNTNKFVKSIPLFMENNQRLMQAKKQLFNDAKTMFIFDLIKFKTARM